jgi:hypothetical protein
VPNCIISLTWFNLSLQVHLTSSQCLKKAFMLMNLFLIVWFASRCFQNQSLVFVVKCCHFFINSYSCWLFPTFYYFDLPHQFFAVKVLISTIRKLQFSSVQRCNGVLLKLWLFISEIIDSIAVALSLTIFIW